VGEEVTFRKLKKNGCNVQFACVSILACVQEGLFLQMHSRGPSKGRAVHAHQRAQLQLTWCWETPTPFPP